MLTDGIWLLDTTNLTQGHNHTINTCLKSRYTKKLTQKQQEELMVIFLKSKGSIRAEKALTALNKNGCET